MLFFCQDSISVKSDSLSTKEHSIKAELREQKRDTFILDFDSGIDLDLPIESTDNAKIIILKENSSTDYLYPSHQPHIVNQPNYIYFP